MVLEDDMRTAEIIVKEYLERGYSLESLRVLAESRSEPLCSEMLAIVDAMRPENDAGASDLADNIEENEPPLPSVAEPREEPGDQQEETAADEPLFFVADDDEAVSDDAGVDFDIMAEVGVAEEADATPMTSEESVADIVVGLTEGSEIVSLKPPEEALASAQKIGETGIWSRMWSRVNGVMAMKSDESETDDSAPGELLVMDAAPEMENQVFAEDEREIGEDVLLESDAEPQSCEAPGNTAVEMPVLADNSADYIPGSVIFHPVDAATAEEIAEAIAEATDFMSMDSSSAEGDECSADLEEQADAEALADELPETDARYETGLQHLPALHVPEEKKGRRQRRRERGERKKGRRAGKKAAAESQDLPEIVLAKSDGSETMVPEAVVAEMPKNEAVTQSEEAAMAFDAETAEANVVEDPVMLVTSDGFLSPDSIELPTLKEDTIVEYRPDSESPVSEAVTDSDEAAEAVASDLGAENSGAQPETDEHFIEAGDHLMILATGGLDLREDAYMLLAGALADEDLDEAAGFDGDNVIHFRDLLPPYDGLEEIEEYDEERPVLHILPAMDAAADEEEMAEEDGGRDTDAGEVEADAESAVASSEGLSPLTRMSLARACAGLPAVDETLEDDADIAVSSEHVILSVADDAANASGTPDSAVQAEIEREYQERLDEFAARLLDVQALKAETEERARLAAEEVAARDEELRRLQAQLKEEAESRQALAADVDAAKKETAAKCRELERYDGIQEEHERLYGEFEDLRHAYNEVVTDVLPELQNERDDLALTVERQSEETELLRGSLGSVRRRLAAGYSLAAAACLVLVAMPIANWLKSGDSAKELAMDHQKVTEHLERLERVEKENIEAEKTIKNLRRDIEMARIEVAKLEDKNASLTRLADQHARELASAKSALRNGTPSRTTSNLALQGSSHPDGRLHTNDVRDPAGQIDRTVAENRNRRQTGDALAQNGGGGLRPPSGRQPERIPLTTVARSDASGQSRQTRPGGTTAKVKAGEGVAQVVYRVLGTRDPDVINWVIRENKIKRDRRGNPLIYENQELRLPENGRTTQAASAARRR